MNHKYFIDKEDWPAGVWQTEPDQVTWIDADTGYRCQIKRNIYGAWVGAVGVEPAHPLYNVSYPNDVYRNFDCHGGISWAGFDADRSIEFAPPTRVWWIGFECMREGDYAPKPRRPTPVKRVTKALLAPVSGSVSGSISKPEYRDSEYAMNEVGLLAPQIINVEPLISNCESTT
jgi:hypothetical protein